VIEQATTNLSWTPLLPRVSKLAAVELLALAMIGMVAYWSHGTQGLVAALIAASVCWLGAVMALIVTSRPADARQAISMVYAAVLLRGAFPLVVAVVLRSGYPSLVAAGLMIYIILFYLVTLASETFFSVIHLSMTRHVQRHGLDY